MARRTKTPAPSVPPPLALPGELTIYTVGELHPQWCAWLALTATSGKPARVQADAVDQVDAAGLQLLLALQRQLSERGQALQLHAPSPVLHQACETLGLAAWLQARTATSGASA